MIRDDGTTPAADYVKALIAGATPEQAHQAAYRTDHNKHQEHNK